MARGCRAGSGTRHLKELFVNRKFADSECSHTRSVEINFRPNLSSLVTQWKSKTEKLMAMGQMQRVLAELDSFKAKGNTFESS